MAARSPTKLGCKLLISLHVAFSRAWGWKGIKLSMSIWESRKIVCSTTVAQPFYFSDFKVQCIGCLSKSFHEKW